MPPIETDTPATAPVLETVTDPTPAPPTPSEPDAPSVTWQVVLENDADRGLTQGEVIGVTAHHKKKLGADLIRPATEAEVELAQPRVRP